MKNETGTQCRREKAVAQSPRFGQKETDNNAFRDELSFEECWKGRNRGGRMDRNRLQRVVGSGPRGMRTIYLLIDEDTYETKCGDGYYPHFLHAFWSPDSAEASLNGIGVHRIACRRHPGAGPCFEQVVGPNMVGSAYHVIPATVELGDDRLRVTWSHYFEHGDDIQDRIVASLPEKAE